MQRITTNEELDAICRAGRGVVYNDFSGRTASKDNGNVVHAATCRVLVLSTVSVAKLWFEDLSEAIAWLIRERGADGRAWRRCGVCSPAARASSGASLLREAGDDLEALLAQAHVAAPNDRIAFRDPIAAFGLAAIPAMTRWIGDVRLGAFAIRVLEKIAVVDRSVATTALRRGSAVATPDVQRDVTEALHRIGSHGSPLSPRSSGSGRPPSGPTIVTTGRGGRSLARKITEAFMAGDLDLRMRRGAPEPGWDGMPEFIGARKLRAAGATDPEVRLWLTFTVAMDRTRDADVLADASFKMWLSDPWAFDADEIVARGEHELGDLLRTRKVSQKHSQDAPAWRRVAQSLGPHGLAPAVRRAVYDGTGDARELLRAVEARDRDKVSLFPLLRGPKIARLWIRELVYPGRATVTHLDAIEVAVDVQVRKVTEYLGVTDTGGLSTSTVREVIQRVWQADVQASGAVGPGPIQNTCAALDPALWFFAKWGCTYCEQVRRPVAISPICDECRFPARL